MKKVIYISIIAFWLLMMGWLAQREIAPAIRNAMLAENIGAGYQPILKDARWETSRRYGIFYGDDRIGEIVTHIRPQRGFWTITNNISLRTALPEGLIAPFVRGGAAAMISRVVGGVQASVQAVVDENFNLVSMSGSVRRSPSMDIMATLDGKVVGRRMVITITEADDERRVIEVPLERGNIMAGGPGGLMNFPEPYIGRRWRAQIMHPLTHRMESSHSVVVDRETIDIQGQAMELYRVETDWAGMTMVSYIDMRGELMLQETPVGIRLIREPDRPEDLRDLRELTDNNDDPSQPDGEEPERNSDD